LFSNLANFRGAAIGTNMRDVSLHSYNTDANKCSETRYGCACQDNGPLKEGDEHYVAFSSANRDTLHLLQGKLRKEDPGKYV
jgi:hypothetical protein